MSVISACKAIDPSGHEYEPSGQHPMRTIAYGVLQNNRMIEGKEMAQQIDMSSDFHAAAISEIVSGNLDDGSWMPATEVSNVTTDGPALAEGITSETRSDLTIKLTALGREG